MALRWLRSNNLFVPLLVTIILAAAFFAIELDMRYESISVPNF